MVARGNCNWRNASGAKVLLKSVTLCRQQQPSVLHRDVLRPPGASQRRVPPSPRSTAPPDPWHSAVPHIVLRPPAAAPGRVVRRKKEKQACKRREEDGAPAPDLDLRLTHGRRSRSPAAGGGRTQCTRAWRPVAAAAAQPLRKERRNRVPRGASVLRVPSHRRPGA